MSQTTIADHSSQLDQYISQQIQKTGAQVRMIDLFTSLMTLFAGLLAGLFFLSLIDAWVFELGSIGRWICFVLLLAVAGYYLFRVIAPLTIRKINPVYAAKVVEESRPSMKNSLINYVLLRRHRRDIPRPVIDAVGNQAANNISGLAVENTVDKSHTIRIALLLTLLVIVFGIYKVLSPKDPFQTFARILAPASNITKPARVRISNVTPGDADIYFGQKLAVSADIAGNFSKSDVRIIFSTHDGQIVDYPISMEHDSRSTYRGELKTGATGVEQGLTYRVVAGDGQTRDYHVNLKSTPTMTVESIFYRPPSYTGLPERTTEGTSEIEAIEGSQVTINGVANTEIGSAYVELLDQNDAGTHREVGTVSMDIESETRASCQFVLHLNSSRERQKYTHYRLRFVTSDGERNQPTAAYPIRVIPDLAPEIQILEPVDTSVAIPANSRLRFKVRASDPDFEIDSIQILIDHRGSRIMRDDLDLDGQDNSQEIESDYDFWPKKINMRPGQTAIVSFAASDNRRSAISDIPDPNVTMSENIVISIVDPIDNPPSDPDQNKKGQNADEQNADEQASDDASQGHDKQQPSSGDPNPDQTGQRSQPGDQSNDSADPQSRDESNDSNNQRSSEQQTGDENRGDQKDSQASQNSGDAEAESQESKDQGSSQEQGQAQQQGNKAGESQGSDSTEGSKDDSQSSSGQASTQSNQNSDQPAKSGQGQSDSGSNTNDSPESIQTSGDASDSSTNASQTTDNAQGGENSPVSEDAHDGELFQRVMEYQEEQQSQSDQSQGDPSQGDPSQGDPSQGDQSQGDPSQGDPSQGNPSQGNQSQGNPSQGGQSNQGEQTQGAEQSQGQPKQAGQSRDGADKSSASDQSNSSESKGGGQDSQNEADPAQQSGSKPNEGQGTKQQTTGSSDQKGTENEDAQNTGASNQGEQTGPTQQNEKGGASGGGQDSAGNQSEQQKDEKQSSGNSGSQENQDEKQDPAMGGGGALDEKKQGSSGQQDGSQSKSGGQKDGSSQGASQAGSQSGDQKSSGVSQNAASEKGDSSADPSASNDQSTRNSTDSQSGNQQGNSQNPQPSGSSGASQSDDQQPTEGQQQGSGDKGSDSEQSNASSQGKQGTTSQSNNSNNANNQAQSQASSNQQSDGSQPGAGSSSGDSDSGDASVKLQGDQTPSQADKANLEYTKKATDMVLDYLSNQETDPDPKLLNDLKWTEDDLRDFVKRWRELKKAGDSGDQEDRKQWDQTLRSLGMSPPKSAMSGIDVNRDKRSGYNEDGRVLKPPVDLEEKFRAFQKRRNRASDR